MFGIAWSELLLIGIVALVVIPPKDLPAAMRLVGKWVGQMRRMAFDFQHQVSSALREAEFDDLKKTFTEATSIDAMADIRSEIESATRPLTEMEGQFREDLSIAPEIKSFPVTGSIAGDDMGIDARPTLEADTSTPPGPVDWPGAMTAEPAEMTVADRVDTPPEVTRLPAHLRMPDPEPEDAMAHERKTSERDTTPSARVSGI